ncbi:protein unc-13 homolog D-like [Ornithodoros turicata]|uniref:protein unc-13 homolog D-like n=1 Tax=Ornithodoros turicata TaxID=34597 RepID=UPI0031396DFD
MPLTNAGNGHVSSASHIDYEEEVANLFDPISSEDFFELCLQCLFVSEFTIGKSVKPYSALEDELRTYVRTVFDEAYESSTDEQLLQATKEFPRPVVDLEVTIMQAEGLVSKDVSGKSDPYCTLYVEPSHKFHTSVQPQTVTPRWNETFRLRLDDHKRSVVTIEVWDKDPRTICGTCREIYNIRSCSSCCVFLRELMEVLCGLRVDDFMGAFRKVVSDIPCTGSSHWYPLQDMHGQGAYGKIFVKLEFHCVPPEAIDSWKVLKYHYYLSLLFLLHNASILRPGAAITWKHWEDCLSEEGLTLLYHHAMHNGLREIEQCFCRIISLTNVLRAGEIRINFSVLYLQLDKMRLLSRNSDNQLIKNCLEAVVKIIAQFSLKRFPYLHERFRFTSKYERIDLLGLLSCCVSVEALATLEVTDSACDEIRIEARKWYKTLSAEYDFNADDFAVVTHTVQSVLMKILEYHEEADRIFKTAWNETYSNIVQKELDLFIASSFKARIVQFCANLNTKSDHDITKSIGVENSLKMFFALQTFHDTILKSLPQDRRSLELDALQDWFGSDVVSLWFKHAEAPVSEWISKLVLRDDMSPVARDMKQGSSVRDTMDIFHARYVLLWEKLRHKTFECVSTFSGAISRGSTHFAKAMYDRIVAEGHFDVEGEFEISKRLCVAISSLTVLSTYVQGTITMIERTAEADSELCPKVTQLIFPLETALDNILAICTRVCKEATEKLKPEFQRRVTDVADADTAETQERALYELVRYVDACVLTLHESLEPVAFRKMLRLLWRIAVDAVKAEATTVQSNCLLRLLTAPLAFEGLQKALSRMKDVFHADGSGLPVSDINIEPFVLLERQLGTLLMSLES